MATPEEILLIARLQGKTEVIRGAAEISGSLDEVAISADEAGLAMERSGRRGFFMNQAFFTMRRLAYGATLAVVGTGIAALRMGFQFNSAMQQARVSLQPVSASLGGVNKELNYLFNFTKYTPFQFKDVTIAFRQMFAALHPLGIGVGVVNTTLHSLVDALAYAGKTSPTNLQRVSLALQHMAYQGRLTGYAVNQLARDGIPIFSALRQELGLTGDQLHSVATLGIPAQVVLKAINDYIESTPGFANAAYRQATGSLHGLFTTFKDNLSQLMGNMETGVFSRFQNRLIRFNAFFGRISNQMKHHVSFATIVGDAFGGTAEFVWKQFAADVSLVWRIFTGFLRDVVKSRGTWAIIISALIILHGILVPIAFMVDHFGGALSVLLPLLVLWKVYTMVMNGLLATQRFLLAADAGELGELSLAQMLYNRTISGSFRAIMLLRNARSALNVLFTGRAIGTEFRALTRLERVALSLRGAFLRMFAPLAAIVAESWAFTASLLANPITWIVLGILALTAGLVILYFKWKAFHDIVNKTIGFLYHHPLLAMFVPVIGPLIAIAHLFMSIYHHLHQIYNLLRHPLRTAGNMFSLHSLEGLGMGALKMAVPFLAGGGVVTRPGQVVVGDNGPELLSLPSGASVMPLNAAAAGGGGPVQPIQINFVVGHRVLERVMVDIINGRVSNR
jgi:tape measure domain-containing protein